MMKRPSSTQREEEWKKFLEVMERVHARQPRTKKTPQEQEEKPAREIKEFKKQKARRVGKSHLKADEQEIFEALQALVKTPPSLAALQEAAKKSGADKLTLEEIEAEIEEVQQAKYQKKPKS